MEKATQLTGNILVFGHCGNGFLEELCNPYMGLLDTHFEMDLIGFDDLRRNTIHNPSKARDTNSIDTTDVDQDVMYLKLVFNVGFMIKNLDARPM